MGVNSYTNRYLCKNACSDASRFVLHCIYTNDTNSAALSDVNCLFSVVLYLGIEVDGFDAIFDCITNMIGRFFICKLSSRRHVTMQHAKDLMGKRELVALLNLSSWCLVTVEQLFLAVPRGCLQFMFVVFLDHTHYFLVILILTFTSHVTFSYVFTL